MDVVVVMDCSGCGCGAISGPLRLHLVCGLEWKPKYRAKQGTACANTTGRPLWFFSTLETGKGGEQLARSGVGGS